MKVISSRQAFTGQKLSISIDSLQLQSGSIIEFEKVAHPGAVVILPKNQDGTLVLIRQYRHAIGEILLEFPAGTCDQPTETALQCAMRELAEEIGCHAEQWIELGKLYPAPGFCNEVQHCFFACDLRAKFQQPDQDEVIEVVHMSCKQVEDAIASLELTDAKSIALFYRARQRKLI